MFPERGGLTAPQNQGASNVARKTENKTQKTHPRADDWHFVEEVLDSPRTHTIFLWGPPGTG